MTQRSNMTPEERAEINAVEKSLKVSSYLDEVLESIHSGKPARVNVPNYGNSGASSASEPQGFGMDMDGMYHDVASTLDEGQMKTAMTNAHTPREDGETTFSHASSQASSQSTTQSSTPRFMVSKNQALAIKKFPSVVEFLGQPGGEKIAKRVREEMNIVLADNIQSNSKEANKFAVACKPDRQNLKQYFQGEDWLCRVTASGPFRGDEAIYYNKDRDAASILRRSETDGQIKYDDVSTGFNFTYEAEEGEFPSASENTKLAEESVEEKIETEGIIDMPSITDENE